MRWWVIWSLVIILVAWWEREKTARVWRIHRPVQRLERTHKVKPIIFSNASVLWLNAISKDVDMTLKDVSDPALGDVNIEKLEMRIYNDAGRSDLTEIYAVDFTDRGYDTWNYSMIQYDVHLSPFRRIAVIPHVSWTLGGGGCDWCFPRWGYFKRGWWIEPRPFSWAPWLILWAVGAYRACKRSDTGRQRRIFRV